MSRPVAVLISDVHYNITNLQLADAAMRQAIQKANELNVPMIIAGDLHDTKANLRGECVKAMVETFRSCNSPPYILIGNHDKINEKSSDNSLEFLAAYGAIIDYMSRSPLHKIGYLIPYQHNVNELKSHLKTLPKGSTLIMHQGIQGSNMGDYIQDKSALSPEDVSGFRVISGHYHSRQTIDLPDGGKWDYIGNPFTVSYGEANDPPKGFQILMEDGSLEFVPTNLRKHLIYEAMIQELVEGYIRLKKVNDGDLLWIKLKGSKEGLSEWSKERISKFIKVPSFRLDLIPLETTSQLLIPTKISNSDLLDSLIDSLSNTSDDRKKRLKSTWKSLCE